ncbi:MAG: hypothetical protein U9N77_06645 [Thermodesulfobacteriota bacterium]|nr:hypothetical protein [Thermodesulfobacteriota bacterium]
MAKDQKSLQDHMDELKKGDSEKSDAIEDKKSKDNTEKIAVHAEKASGKKILSKDKEEGETAEVPFGPVGLDIGTSHIIVAQNKKKHIKSTNQLNAFFTIPYSKFAKSILVENNIFFYEQDQTFYIVGYSAQNFAYIFDTVTKRSMKSGLLCSSEKDGLTVIQSIVLSLIQKPKILGELLCFGVPGEPVYGTGLVTYHESVIKMFLGRLGYTPISVNEGMAVVLSELGSSNYTGIGISIGGGMCNVCLSYMSFPVITFSIQIAGDYIDASAGAAVGVPATRVKATKEKDFSLVDKSKDRVATALQIFYEEVINKLLSSMERVFATSNQMPMISKPIPIALSGGSVMVDGFQKKFEAALTRIKLPFEVSSVNIAEDPLNATAKGALIMAMSEKN